MKDGVGGAPEYMPEDEREFEAGDVAIALDRVDALAGNPRSRGELFLCPIAGKPQLFHSIGNSIWIVSRHVKLTLRTSLVIIFRNVKLALHFREILLVEHFLITRASGGASDPENQPLLPAIWVSRDFAAAGGPAGLMLRRRSCKSFSVWSAYRHPNSASASAKLAPDPMYPVIVSGSPERAWPRASSSPQT